MKHADKLGIEPKVEKARKLARLAAGGATEAERTNAAERLREHMTRYGITENDLSARSRQMMAVDCVDPKSRRKNRRDKDINKIAFQILAWVMGFEEGRQILMRKTETHDIMMAELSPAECLDFEDAWRHYLPAFLESRKALRKAVKMAATGFMHKMDLLMPSDGRPSTLTMEEIEAIIAAAKAATGDKWERPAGRLDSSNFKLSMS